MVSCHRQAARTTERRSRSRRDFGLGSPDQVGQPASEEVDHHLNLGGRGTYIQPAVEVEKGLLGLDVLNPELRNLGASEFVVFALCVFGEDQSFEPNRVVDLASYPSPSAGGSFFDLGDHQVEVCYVDLFACHVCFLGHVDQSDSISDFGCIDHGWWFFRLEDFTEQAFLHRIDRFAGQEVFDKKRAGALWLLCVGDLEEFGQSVDPFDRFVVGLADLLGLVWIHRSEGVAKDLLVGFFVCGGHRLVPCGVVLRCSWLLLVLDQVLKHLLLFVELVEFCLGFFGFAKVAIGEVGPAQAAGLVVEHRGRILYGSLGSPEHLFGGLCNPFLGVRNHPLESVELFLDGCDRWVCGGVVHRRFSVFALGFSFGVTTHFPCVGQNIKALWEVIFWIVGECFRSPQTAPFGHSRVVLDLGVTRPSNEKTPTRRKRGAMSPIRLGLTLST